MKDLTFYTQYAKTLLSSLNIPFVDCPVEVNGRLTRTWGQCWHQYSFGVVNHRITLNPILLEDKTDDDALMNTLLHEYLHTCPKCNNHGALWKRYADMINRKYHYNIKRCTSSEEKGFDVEKMDYKYIVVCPKCNSKSGFKRRSRVVDTAERHGNLICKCGYRGKDFKVIYPH